MLLKILEYLLLIMLLGFCTSFFLLFSLSNVIFFEEFVSLIPPFLGLGNNFVFIVLLFWRGIIFIIAIFSSEVCIFGLEEILTIYFDRFPIEPLLNVLEVVHTDLVQLWMDLLYRTRVKNYVIVSLLGLLLLFSLLQCPFLLLSLLFHPC